MLNELSDVISATSCILSFSVTTMRRRCLRHCAQFRFLLLMLTMMKINRCCSTQQTSNRNGFFLVLENRLICRLSAISSVLHIRCRRPVVTHSVPVLGSRGRSVGRPVERRATTLFYRLRHASIAPVKCTSATSRNPSSGHRCVVGTGWTLTGRARSSCGFGTLW